MQCFARQCLQSNNFVVFGNKYKSLFDMLMCISRVNGKTKQFLVWARIVWWSRAFSKSYQHLCHQEWLMENQILPLAFSLVSFLLFRHKFNCKLGGLRSWGSDSSIEKKVSVHLSSSEQVNVSQSYGIESGDLLSRRPDYRLFGGVYFNSKLHYLGEWKISTQSYSTVRLLQYFSFNPGKGLCTNSTTMYRYLRSDSGATKFLARTHQLRELSLLQ